MKRPVIALASLAFKSSVSALVPHSPEPQVINGNWTFTLTAHGKVGGPIGQLPDGQNRIGGNLPTAHYVFKQSDKGGVLHDEKERACILTPPNTTQWQCDEGGQATGGFDISCEMQLLYKGSTQFYACPVNELGEWNIYRDPQFGQKKCVIVTLEAEGNFTAGPQCAHAWPVPSEHACGGKDKDLGKCKPTQLPGPVSSALPNPPLTCENSKCPTSSMDGICGGNTGFSCFASDAGSCCSSAGWCGSTPAHCGKGCQSRFGLCDSDRSPSKATSPDVVSNSTGCPIDLNGEFEFPHLMVPVDRTHMSKSYGNKLNATINEDFGTTFTFDIPPNLIGMTCSLLWLFPEQHKLATSSYNFSTHHKPASLQFWRLEKPVQMDTNWASLGDKALLAAGPAASGVSFEVATHACPAGERLSFMVTSQHVHLEYFQDFNPSPIGLYVRAC